MTTLKRIAFIGNSLPRRCGIATFTTDLEHAVAISRPDIETAIVAMTDNRHSYEYPAAVRIDIHDDLAADYLRAAEFLNAGRYDVVCLQHEFGIFGGEAGGLILELLTRLNMPIVTTLHTVLLAPTPDQRVVMLRLIDVSTRVIVMAEKAAELLRTVYRVLADKIEVIPHGIPDFPFVEPDSAKEELGFKGKAILLTFGLLSPNKGIEVMIDALPLILRSRPDTVYVVLGATHPNLVREQGEAYRESLAQRARELGVEDHVVFLDRFVELAMLLEFISMCDVYVTPYLNEAQMTSGTLAYSFGLGKAVVSTPYWHAQELLAEGRGIMVPFGNAAALGREIAGLLTDDARRQVIRKRAYADSRSMTWEHTAERYLGAFESAQRGHRLRVVPRPNPSLSAREHQGLPELKTAYLLSMCDDTGLFQHAVHAVPNRDHGYCVDDNARALLVACALNAPGEQPLSEPLTARFAAFIQHAWNADARRFRNFMSFSRDWLEDQGSEDSHGRTLWALGECARRDATPSRRQWATELFATALPAVEQFRSPRAWAFALLGLDAYCATVTGDAEMARMRYLLADRLLGLLRVIETPHWAWFEEGLAYDNARLSQALIVTGIATATPTYTDAGLRSLRWLTTLQTAPAGHFRPVGTESFGDSRTQPKPFDQQPVEAAAMVSACLTAWRANGELAWKADAMRAFAWFLGGNDLAVSLVDIETGSCRDGLHPDRRNENRGGESVVAYLHCLSELRRVAHASEGRPKFVARLA
jgi:glycosyltransferase involved in cell wall biosynthesis